MHPSAPARLRGYLGGDPGGGGVGDLVVVDGPRDHAPHQSDGVVCGGGDGEVQGYVQA